jgi:hypothetical protein
MNTNNWKWVKLKKIFPSQNCKSGKCNNATELLEPGNGIAYIGAKKNDNGIMDFVKSNSKLTTNGNCIVLIGDGQGSVGYSLYQPDDFIGSTTITACYNEHLNSTNAIFLVTILDLERFRYSFGRKYKTTAIQNTEVKLPVKNNEIDWKTIEDYIRNTLIPKLPQKAKSIWLNQYETSPLNSKKLNLTDRKWEYFIIGKLFDCNRTSSAVFQTLQEGNTPFVTRSAENNGVSAYVDAENCEISNNNCITIGGEGIFAFYQPQYFATGTNIVTLRHEKLNSFNAMFLCTILNMETYRYNYGHARSFNRIKKERIKLPIDDEGKPDWLFMENYIKGLPYSRNI